MHKSQINAITYSNVKQLIPDYPLNYYASTGYTIRPADDSKYLFYFVTAILDFFIMSPLQ